MDTPAGRGDEVWTVGEAATYLNAGGVDFGFTSRRVRSLAGDPGSLVRAVSGGTPAEGRRRWYRLLASSVRAERARLLKAAGLDDPNWPAREGSE